MCRQHFYAVARFVICVAHYFNTLSAAQWLHNNTVCAIGDVWGLIAAFTPSTEGVTNTHRQSAEAAAGAYPEAKSDADLAIAGHVRPRLLAFDLGEFVYVYHGSEAHAANAQRYRPR